MSFELFSNGVSRFVIGLAKKVLIANVIGEMCNILLDMSSITVVSYLLVAIGFTIQIYFDFSGYSDMAIGLGKMFGFNFLENFNYPLVATSVTDFWRRWHISLSSFFRDYIYIPLGGNRVNKIKFIRNILIVWLLTGFWHGAAWNFILWGLIFAVFLIAEKLWLLKWLKKAKIWNHIYVLFVVLCTFVIFNAANMQEAGKYLGGMFGFGSVPLWSKECIYYLKSYGCVLGIAMIGATPLPRRLWEQCCKNEKTEKILFLLEPILLVALLLIVTAYLVDGSFNPFLYFRF